MATEGFKTRQKAQDFIESTHEVVRGFYVSNTEESLFLFKNALLNFQKDGVKGTRLEKEFAKAGEWKNANIALMQGGQKESVYGVKIETNNGTKIFTLRVGKDFTELSFEMNRKFVEILREEKGEIRHEKFV